MTTRLRLRPALLVFAVLALACSAAGAQSKDRNRNDELNRRRDEIDRRIRENERALDALRQQESNLTREVDRLERELPTVEQRVKQSENDAKEADRATDAVRAEINQHREAVKAASQQLAEVGKRIEDSQPSGSPFAQARNAYLAAQSAYQQKTDEVTASAEYRQAYESAVASANRAVLMPQVRKQYLDENPAIVALRDQVTATKAPYLKLQEELMASNSQYAGAVQAAERVRSDEARAEKQLRELAATLTTAKRAAAKTRTEMAAMETALHRDRDALKKIPNMRERLQRQIENDRLDRQRLR
jgi:chromosome segregation ATPase